MSFHFFIGVDVSKNALDFAIRNQSRILFYLKTSNDTQGVKAFFKRCADEKIPLSKSLLCLEYTGIYNNIILQLVDKKNICTWLEHGRQIKQSLGMVRGKNDQIDAKRICQYAFRFQDKAMIWKPDRIPLQALKQLVSLRRRLINTKNQLKTPMKENQKWIPKEILKQVNQISLKPIKVLEEQIKLIDKKISDIIKADERLNHLFEIVTSVTGVGPVLAHEFILTTKEFTAIKDAKKYAAYSGIAPFDNQSGTSLNAPKRVSQMANKATKKLLHMSALSVVSRDGEMTNFYRRKVAEGKNKMLVINAVRNKIVQRVFACVRKNEKYDENYSYLLA